MKPTEIKYVRNQFHSFIAVKKFTLGNTGIDVTPGELVNFDGSMVEINGQTFPFAQLKGTVGLGWLVLEEDYDPDAALSRVPSANIQVRSAVNMNPNSQAPAQRNSIITTDSDERVVMSTHQRTAAAQQQTANARGQNQGMARSFSGSGEVKEGGSEFGVPVARSFKTRANTKTEVTPSSVGSAMRDADQVKIDPGQGVSQDDVLSTMTDEQVEAYLAKKESKRGDVASRLNPKFQGAPTTRLDPMSSPVVGRVKTAKSQTSEGITSRVTTSGGQEIYDPSTGNSAGKQSYVEVEGIRMTNTNGPMVRQPQVAEEAPISKIEKDGTADARRMVAKSICADFPDQYNFADHWKRRIAMIRLNYEGRADIIRAVFAAESDDFKKTLLEEFPEVFS